MNKNPTTTLITARKAINTPTFRQADLIKAYKTFKTIRPTSLA